MKSPKLLFTFTFIVFMNIMHVFGGTPVQVHQFINHKDWSFIENKGQLADNNGKLISNIKFYSHEGGAHIYCRPGKISFVFTKIEKENNQNISEATGKYLSDVGVQNFEPLHRKLSPSKITTNHIDLILHNSNLSALITPSDQQQYYENFYLAHTPEEGVTNVQTYKTITYKNIYPHIDMVLHSKESGMKYEFVVYPGGKVSDIQLQWNGLDKIQKLENSNIKYTFPLGNMTETAPYTYTANVGAGFTPAQNANVNIPILGERIGKGDRKGSPYIKTNTQIIQSNFILKNNRIGFKVEDYDKRKVLVIDPTLNWGTYFGSLLWDYGFGGTAIDKFGNILITGGTESTTDIASQGAYQTSYGGNITGDNDAYIAKFSPNGGRLWSTYFGGSGGEDSWGIISDKLGNIYITGTTNSLSGISTSSSYQSSNGGYTGPGNDGPWDAFLAKFSASGSRTWSTYFGGSGIDEGRGIGIDLNNNILITGGTSSSSDIASQGAYQENYSGINDAFIAKFTQNGSLIWSTYFGSYTGGEKITSDSYGNVIATGSESNGDDIFIVKFTSSGSLIWDKSFGNSGREWVGGLTIDVFDNILLTGYTSSTNGIATNGAYQTALAGGPKGSQYDAFIAKFSASDSLEWATYLGGKGVDAGFGIVTDKSGNIFITGYTSSDSGIASAGAYQTSFGGNYDVFISEFSSSGNHYWSTYYGGSGVELPYGISIDTLSNLYIAGVTNSTNGIATPGTYKSIYNGIDEAFIAKFSANDIGVFEFENRIDSICPGYMDAIVVKVKNYGIHPTISATIHWSVNGQIQDSVIWNGVIKPDSFQFVNLGIYKFINPHDTVIVWTTLNNAKDENPNNDTGKLIVKTLSNVHFSGAGQSSYSICNGSHIRIGTNGIPGNKYLWTSDPKGLLSTFPNPIVNPDSFTTFYLTETNTRTGCINMDNTTVTVKTVKAPTADAGKSKSICWGDSALIGSNNVAGLNYLWSSEPAIAGFTSSLSKLYVTPDETTIYTVQVTNSTGCTDINSDTITVNPIPLAITGPVQFVCSGNLITLGISAIPGHTYFWTSTPGGFASTLSNPIDTAKITKTYALTETITSTGCHKADSVSIDVVPRPVVKIQTDSLDAFTRKFSALNPNYPANMYKWKISDGDTATGYSITHTFKNEGNYTAKLSVSIPGFCVDSDSVKVDIHPPFSLKIFPNPYSINADIRYILVNPAHIKIMIFDMLGRQITTLVDTRLETGEYNTPINASILKTRPDMYLVVFMIDDKIITRKVVQLDSIYY